MGGAGGYWWEKAYGGGKIDRGCAFIREESRMEGWRSDTKTWAARVGGGKMGDTNNDRLGERKHVGEGESIGMGEKAQVWEERTSEGRT